MTVPFGRWWSAMSAPVTDPTTGHHCHQPALHHQPGRHHRHQLPPSVVAETATTPSTVTAPATTMTWSSTP